MDRISAEFEVFKRSCQVWLDFLGLKDWRVAYDKKMNQESYAQCDASVEGNVAVLSYCYDPNMGQLSLAERDVNMDAFHEVMHVLMARIMFLAECRFGSQEELRAEEERLIRTLESTIYPATKKFMDDLYGKCEIKVVKPKKEPKEPKEPKKKKEKVKIGFKSSKKK